MTVRATRRQVDELLAWAARFEDRTWAIESAGGLGYLLAPQLVAAGERVLDVPATLAARVRVLGSGRSNKNDPNDALSVAIAALRAPRLARVGRRRSCGRVAAVREAQQRSGSGPEPDRVSAACVVGRARPGRNPQGNQRSQRRSGSSPAVTPTIPVERARHDLGVSSISRTCVASTSRCAPRRSVSRRRSTQSGTTLTDLFGVGPVVAAMVIGYTGDVTRFANRDHFAAYTGTAPIEVSSGGRIVHRLSRRGNRQLNHAIHIAAITQIRFAHSPGRAFYDRKVARRQDEARSGPRVEASDQRRALPPAAPRRREHGPGRANGDGSAIQRDRPRTPTAGASEEPLPDPTQR